MEGEKTKGGKKENELQTFRAFLFPVFEIPNPARQGGTVNKFTYTSQVNLFLCGQLTVPLIGVTNKIC